MRCFIAYPGSLLFGTLVLFATGCQQGTLNRVPSQSILGAAAGDLNSRAASAAQTPIRKSANQNLATLASQQQPNQRAISQQQATFERSQQQPRLDSEVVPAGHVERAGQPSVNPAIYAINQPVPKVQMPPQVYPTSTLAQPVAHGRPVGPASSAHGNGCGGACCNPTQGYSPVYPQFDSQSNAACSGANTCSQPCYPTYQPRYTDPQEYVYDGGDRPPQAMLRDDLSIVGLDSEDTVMRYETTNGQVQVQAGCRVPIYAPRFASTRKIASIGLSDHVVATQAALLDQRPGGMKETLPPTKVADRRGPQGENAVKVLEAYRERNRGVPVAKILPAVPISDAFKPYEDLQLIRSGRFIDTQLVLLKKGTAAAKAWSSIDQLEVIIDNQMANLIVESTQPAELYNYELGGNRVRLCKIASHQVAEPGDIIDFTIRFDNTGDQPITNILVQDSLAPRLEYVEDSQKSSLKTEFTSEPNDVGSATLSWKVLEPVKPGEGGFLRFQVKVR